MGKLKGIQVSLRVSDESAVFTKARVVLFAIRSKYEQALEKLVAEDIIVIVPMVKANGDLRICGDLPLSPSTNFQS